MAPPSRGRPGTLKFRVVLGYEYVVLEAVSRVITSMADSEFVLFDVDCTDRICWSPNTFRPRTVLALKNIKYKTEWLSYPDIEGVLRQHGQEDKKTVLVPVLKHGDRYIPDSWDIAKYLEEIVPTPSIFSGGLEAQEHFRKYADGEVKRLIFFWIVSQVPAILDERGRQYFVETRTKQFGKSLEEATTSDDVVLPQLRGALTPCFHALRKSGAFLMGDEFSYADSQILSLAQWIKRANAEKFEKLMALDADGNFSAWWKRCEPYMSHMG